jgi:hypothetical protein
VWAELCGNVCLIDYCKGCNALNKNDKCVGRGICGVTNMWGEVSMCDTPPTLTDCGFFTHCTRSCSRNATDSQLLAIISIDRLARSFFLGLGVTGAWDVVSVTRLSPCARLPHHHMRGSYKCIWYVPHALTFKASAFCLQLVISYSLWFSYNEWWFCRQSLTGYIGTWCVLYQVATAILSVVFSVTHWKLWTG